MTPDEHDPTRLGGFVIRTQNIGAGKGVVVVRTTAELLTVLDQVLIGDTKVTIERLRWFVGERTL